MQTQPKHLAALWALLLFSIIPARADTLFSSFGPGGSFTTAFGYGIGGPFEMAYSFVVTETANFDATALGIASPAISLQRSVNIALMSDASDSPGNVLESFQLVNVLPFSGTIAPPIVVDSVNHPLLEANTRYWLSIANPGNSGEIDWGTAGFGPGFGPPLQRASRQLGSGHQWSVNAPDSFLAGAFDVTGTPVSSTPEPSSLLLFGGTLVAIIWAGGLRRKV